MPRHTPASPTSVRINADTLDRVRAALHDPIRGRVRYGSLSALINSLLLNWLAAEAEARARLQGTAPSSQGTPDSA